MELRELLIAQQSRLLASLESNRNVVRHPTDLGTLSESDWCAAFRAFLPERYSVGKATIIDCHGAESDAIDLVVFDKIHSPLLFEHNDVLYLPAESVYAVFEVKQDLTKEDVEYAAEKAASVRRLHRTSAAFKNAGQDAEARGLFRIAAGILATKSGWKRDPLGKHLKDALAGIPDEGRLDVGCALHHGGFRVIYESQDVNVEVSDPDAGLIFVLMRLFELLRPMGTVPAIDLEAWGNSIRPKAS